MPRALLSLILTSALTYSALAQQYSELWGQMGEKWDPANSILRNFTQVGYKGGGNQTIPDWPVGVKVTDFGAVPDDGIDDSQAFMDAIAASPASSFAVLPLARGPSEQSLVP